jgi:Rrf2 family protein
MVELAKREPGEPVSLREVGRAQGVSDQYLGQLAGALKIAGLVESVRGATGGYRLARPANEITAWDVYYALDVSVDLVRCSDEDCARTSSCAARLVWSELTGAIKTVLESHDLEELAAQELALEAEAAPE